VKTILNMTELAHEELVTGRNHEGMSPLSASSKILSTWTYRRLVPDLISALMGFPISQL
jgi:hypothetical protein